MSAPGKVSMLPTLLPPTPVPTKVSTSALGDRPTGEVGAVVGDEAGAPEFVDEPACGDNGPHPPRTPTDTTISRTAAPGILLGRIDLGAIPNRTAAR
jgi:hypothetical protein